MTRPEILPIRPWMVHDLAENLREGDLREVRATKLSPFEALLKSVQISIYSRAALVQGRVAALWGIAGVPLLSDIGSVWLMTSPQIEKVPFSLLRNARREVAKMRGFYPRLEGVVCADYPQALRFVEALGFQIQDGPEPILTFLMES